MIKREGGKINVYSESGRRFGSYPDSPDGEAQAKKRLAQMEYFKKIKKEGTEMDIREKLIEKVADSLEHIRKELKQEHPLCIRVLKAGRKLRY